MAGVVGATALEVGRERVGRVLRATVLGGNEYFSTQGGGTNAGFLNALFLDLLARPIDSTSSTFYQGQLAGTASGRMTDGNEKSNDVADLAALLKDTAEHHGSFEAVAPPHVQPANAR